MDKANEGQAGIGDTGYSKYDQKNASTIKNGGNTEIQGDGVVTTTSEKVYYGRPNSKINSY